MEFTLQVVSKVVTKTLQGDLQYSLHVNIAVNNEALEAQGGGLLANFKVDQETWNSVTPGDVFWFKHMTTVKEDGSEN